MALGFKNIVMIAVSLVLLGVVMPLGLAYISGAEYMNITVGGTTQTLAEWVDPSVLVILTVLVPILAVIGIAIAYIKFGSD